ncbi:MAG: ABC transporter permease [Bacteroidales bacterium]|nr:ABC transporter permease [Bacteroidales bacterium]
MIWNLSWKNVWRNKTRSLIVICAIIIGTVAGVFTSGLMKGWLDQRIRSVIYTEVSHIKIRNPRYLDNEEIKYTVNDYNEIKEFLKNSPEVKESSQSINLMCMAQTPWGNSGIIIKGIQPEQEKEVRNLYKFIVEGGGNYLSEVGKKQILISDKTAEQLMLKNYMITDVVIDSLLKSGMKKNLADKLSPLKGRIYRTEKKFKTEVGNLLSEKEMVQYSLIKSYSKQYNLRKRIVLSFVGIDGKQVQYPFRVCGVYKTTNTVFDQMNAFVNYNELLPISGLGPEQYHEINVILNDGDETLKSYKEKLVSRFPEANIMTWKELAPDAGMMEDFMVLYYYIIMGVIFFALAFGIINTMLMAILERIKEIGMLMAVGMNKKRVFRMIMLETVFLTLTGTFIGMILGYLVILITGKTGLDFSSVQEGFEAIGWASKIYPTIEFNFFIGITIMVTIIGILASIIPARKALKLNPVEALRIE